MIELILFISVIVLFVKFNSLEKKIKRLEESPLKQSKQVYSENLGTPPPAKDMGMADNQVMPETSSQPIEYTTSAVGEESVDQKQNQINVGAIIDWLKKDWLMKLGALLLLIGFGWLVTYAFANNWIGPMGRITLGIIAGTGILILGTWRIRTRSHQGIIFTVLGSTIILLTVFAARELYDLFTPFSALAIMFLSTVYVAFVSVKFREKSLAITALILAAIAPNMIGSASPEYVTLFSYLSIIIVGVIWVVFITGWRSLTLLALVVAGIYSVPVLADGSIIEKDTILIFAYGFSALFFIFSIVGLLRVQDKSTKSDIYIAAGNGIFLLTWILEAADKDWQSLIIVSWMLVFSIGAFIIFRYTQRKFAFFIYAGISIGMLAAATAAELNGAALTIAYIIESVIISLVAYAALRDSVIGQKLSFLIIGPILLTFEHIYKFDRSNTVFNEYFFTILALAMGLLILGLFYKYFNQSSEKEKLINQFYVVQLIAGSIYLYILLWFSLKNGLENSSVAAMIAIIIYTIIGLITNIYGKFNASKTLSLYGGGMLAFVIIRLFMVDVWQMELASRVITFFLIGILLMSTAFLNKKKTIDPIINN